MKQLYLSLKKKIKNAFTSHKQGRVFIVLPEDEAIKKYLKQKEIFYRMEIYNISKVASIQEDQWAPYFVPFLLIKGLLKHKKVDKEKFTNEMKNKFKISQGSVERYISVVEQWLSGEFDDIIRASTPKDKLKSLLSELFEESDSPKKYFKIMLLAQIIAMGSVNISIIFSNIDKENPELQRELVDASNEVKESLRGIN